jgi:serine/threonine protein kinase
MGLVYEAIDAKLNRRVALKCARPGFGDRLPPEVRAAREVSHFNVCKVHDLHLASSAFGEMEFVSMEFIDGQTLSERISRDGPLLDTEARGIARQICAGLAQAHRQGIIHGDLKCSNVILSRLPQGGVRAVITDFGLAKMRVIDGTRVKGHRAGTWDYMAPELLRGEGPTVASDLYALGILFHVMLTGHSPKRLKKHSVPMLQESGEIDPKASTITFGPLNVDDQWQRTIEPLASPWKKVVVRCLAPRSEDRFRTAEEVTGELETRPSMLVSAAAVLVAALTLGTGNGAPCRKVRRFDSRSCRSTYRGGRLKALLESGLT